MSVVSHQPKRCGPDFFGYYVHEIVDSLSSLSVGPADNVNMSRDGKEVHDGVSSNKALFHGIIGNSMLEVNKELFKALLREALNTLTIEVDEILDPIICIRHIMFHVKAKEQQATRPLTVPSIPSSSTLVHADANNATPGGQVLATDFPSYSHLRLLKTFKLEGIICSLERLGALVRQSY